MKKKKYFLGNAIYVLCFVAYMGCDTNPISTSSLDTATDNDINSSLPVESMTLDDYYATIAQEVPGFGGLFLDDDGTLNMYFSSVTSKSNALAYQDVLSFMAQGSDVPEYIRGAPSQVLRGEYDFIQLRDWKKLLKSRLRGTGMVFIDADEGKNRVRIGISEPAIDDRIRSIASDLGIPLDAIVTELTDPIVATVSLRDRYRPIQGGFQIKRSDGATCTHGFNVTRQNVVGFITNAHCTTFPGSLDNVSIYQKNVTSNDLIGNETIDPPFQYYGGGGGAAPSPMQPQDDGYKHRKSDSAFIEYSSNLTAQDISFGLIARTQSRATGDNTGSLTKSGVFSITSDKWYQFQHTQGLQLNKIGRTSGWTYGNIVDTCLDMEYFADLGPGDPYYGDDLMMDCQYRVSGLAQSGDSGSPVFHWNGSGDNVTLYGIMWGGTCGAINPFTGQCSDFDPPFIYSTLGDVDSELGPSGTARLVTH